MSKKSLTRIEYEALKANIRLQKARADLLHFTTFTKPDYDVNWHHRIICNAINEMIYGDLDRLMVFVPPRHGKSELISRRLPAFLFGINPDTRIIATSHTKDLASAMNRDVQRIIDSDEYRVLFPATKINGDGVKSKSTWLRNSDTFEIIDRTGVYRCAGVEGGITGKGGDWLFIDDPIKDAAEARSPTHRERVWNWYNTTLRTRREKKAKILIVLTRWHEDDLAGRLLELANKNPMADQWRVVTIPAICEREQEFDPRAIGEALWPSKYDLKDLESTRASDPATFNALYQQRPSAMEGNLFKRDRWKFYEKLPALDEQVTFWDLGVKDKKSSSYAVGQVWGRKGPNIFLVAIFRKQMGILESVGQIMRMRDQYPAARKIIIEDKANGPQAIEILRQEVPGIEPYNPSGSKEERALAQVYWLDSGNVYLPNPNLDNSVYDFIDECANFPNGTHDDQVDVFTMACHYFGNKTKFSREKYESFLRGAYGYS